MVQISSRPRRPHHAKLMIFPALGLALSGTLPVMQGCVRITEVASVVSATPAPVASASPTPAPSPTPTIRNLVSVYTGMFRQALASLTGNPIYYYGLSEGEFASPQRAVVDAAHGFYYISDTNNYRVQKFNLSTGAAMGWIGMIGTAGGTCSAGVGSFSGGWCIGGLAEGGTGDGMFQGGLAGLAIDATHGFLYVSDGSSNRVQKFNLATGTFVGWIGKIATNGGTCTAAVGSFTGGWCSGGTSASGTGDGMMNGPQGLSADVANDFLYVADYGNHRIQKFTLSTGAFVGWIGAIGATGTGTDTCVAAAGSFTGGWCTGGVSATGTDDGMFASPTGVQADSAHNMLYVADTNHHRIQQFALDTGVFVGWTGNIGTAGGTCTAGAGSATGGWCSGGISASGTGDGMLVSPYDLAIDSANGFFYVTEYGSHRIQKFDLTTGAAVGWIGKIASAGGTCTAGVGSFTGGWCAGGTSGSGVTDGMMTNPTGVALDTTNGFLYEVDYGYNRVQKFALTTGAFVGGSGSVKSLKPGWASPVTGSPVSGVGDGVVNYGTDLAVDTAGGFFYLPDSSNHRVVKFNLSTGAFAGWIGKAATTTGMTCAGAPPAVGAFTGGWCLGGTSASGTGNGMMNNPYAIALDVGHNLMFVSDGYNHRIQKFMLSTGAFVGWLGAVGTTGGTCTAAVGSFTGGWCSGGTSATGSGNGMFNYTFGIFADTVGGFLYVTDGYNYRIQKFNLTTGAFVGWIGKIGVTGGTCTAGVGSYTGGWCSGGTGDSGSGNGMMLYASSVTVDKTGGFLYVADGGNNRIQKFNLATGAFVGWIGKAGTTVGMTCTGTVPAAGAFTGGWCSGGTGDRGAGDGMMYVPYASSVDSTGGFLYVADTGNNRIQKFKLSTGAFLGWIGSIGTSPTGGSTGCAGAAVGTITPGWCAGGSAAADGALGGLFYPYAATLSNGSMYVPDYNGKITRFQLP